MQMSSRAARQVPSTTGTRGTAAGSNRAEPPWDRSRLPFSDVARRPNVARKPNAIGLTVCCAHEAEEEPPFPGLDPVVRLASRFGGGEVMVDLGQQDRVGDLLVGFEAEITSNIGDGAEHDLMPALAAASLDPVSLLAHSIQATAGSGQGASEGRYHTAAAR